MIFHPDPHGPQWISIGATCVLVLHIGTGIVGLAGGAVALLATKGAVCTVWRASGSQSPC